MKRAVVLSSLILICITVSSVAVSQSAGKLKARSGVKQVCPFSIVGLWRSDAMTAPNPILFNFSPDGWVSLLDHSAENLPRDFEIVAAVNYRLDKPGAPERIEFRATRGNDVFLRGTTSLQITLYSDDSFTTVNPESGQRADWVRVQTHRYFLTLAARRDSPQYGGPAFAMLTTLDGLEPKTEALGIQLSADPQAKSTPIFGAIPAELYTQITEENTEDKKRGSTDQTVTMRLELTVSEFEKTQRVFETWNKYIKTDSLPYRDPYQNALVFLMKTVEPINQCGERVRFEKSAPTAEIGALDKDNLRRQPLEFIIALRKKNEDLHIKDSFFPWRWRPMLQ